jgi:hypothetical protein
MRLSLYDRALHAGVAWAQRLGAWGFGARLAAFAALTGLNVAAGAAAYRLATGDDW